MTEKMETDDIKCSSGNVLDECFHLSKIFPAHKNDVKCVVGTPTGSIISGSRDGTVKLWTERTGTFKELKEEQNYVVNTIAFYQTADGEWLIFAGIKDGTIEVFNFPDSPSKTILRNHTQNVCVLFVDEKRKLLISGSLDARAIVWSIDRILSGDVEVGYEIGHHKNSVWAVTTLPDTENVCFLTGSADSTIKLHNHLFEEIRTFEGHTDVVRALVAVSSTEFVSAANDGTVRLWNTESGICLQKCKSVAGEFIYAIAKLEHKSGKRFIVAGMEHGFVEVWSLQDNMLTSTQNFRVPVASVWSITTLRNADIVMGASNGAIYIYTTEDLKRASEEVGPGGSGGFVRIGQGTVNNAGSSSSSSYVDPFTGVVRYIAGGGAQTTSGGDLPTSTGLYVPGTGDSATAAYTGQIDKKRPRGQFVPSRQFFDELQSEELKLSDGEKRIIKMMEEWRKEDKEWRKEDKEWRKEDKECRKEDKAEAKKQRRKWIYRTFLVKLFSLICAILLANYFYKIYF